MDPYLVPILKQIDSGKYKGISKEQGMLLLNSETFDQIVMIS